MRHDNQDFGHKRCLYKGNVPWRKYKGHTLGLFSWQNRFICWLNNERVSAFWFQLVSRKKCSSWIGEYHIFCDNNFVWLDWNPEPFKVDRNQCFVFIRWWNSCWCWVCRHWNNQDVRNNLFWQNCFIRKMMRGKKWKIKKYKIMMKIMRAKNNIFFHAFQPQGHLGIRLQKIKTVVFLLMLHRYCSICPEWKSKM